MLMGNDNTVTAQFLDVMDNCTIGQLNVDITCVEKQNHNHSLPRP